MEPWDGPASVTFCDGKVVGAVLDRNGLRPARYWVTKDQRVIFASEVGVLPIDPANIERKGRLQPGRMFLVDIEQGRIIDDEELKSTLVEARPLRRVAARAAAFARRDRRAHDAHAEPRVDRPSAEELRLQRRGPPSHRSTHGPGERGADRLHGFGLDRPDVVEAPATALRLLHATLRPGHQPTPGRHPRRTRHVDARHDRRRGQPAHREREPLSPDRAALTDPEHRRTGEDPLHRRVRTHEGLHDGRHRRTLRGPR